jgi:chromatin segregation and condensation protein Rec8/ScpA/Scc1 (kleisin family)
MMSGRETNAIVEYFLALLFLMDQNQLSAWQEVLFGEILVNVFPKEDSETVDSTTGNSED